MNIFSLRAFLNKNKTLILVIAIFILHLFSRFYAIETKSSFGWDQVDSAWAAKHILVDHQYPLLSSEMKQGSGVYIGSLYYYVVAIFYYLTNMDPIAAGLLAGTISVFGFFVLFYVTKKVFSTKVALIALFINTLSYNTISFERVQWEVNFIPVISLLGFYFLYRILLGNERNIVYFAIILAFALNIHLTIAIFLPLIFLFTLPFFPKTKKTLRYMFLSIPIIFAGLTPIIIYNIITANSQTGISLKYANLSFHGIHLARIIQLFRDAFIQMESFLTFPILKPLAVFMLPIFFIVYFLNIPTKKKLITTSLIFLWFIIPWIVMSTYSGEITDYYFSVNRFVGLIILAYLIGKLFELKNKIIMASLIILACYYAYFGISKFIIIRTTGLENIRTIVKDHIQNGKTIKYEKGNPLSFVYYLYMRKK